MQNSQNPGHLNAVLIGALIAATSHFCAQAQDESAELTVNSATLHSEGKELGAATEHGRLADILKLQKDLVYQVLEQAGIAVDKLPKEVKAALARPHTNNAKAFLALARGLDALDSGDYRSAESAFGDAVKLDPSFDMARELRDAVPKLQQPASEIADAATKQAKSRETVVDVLTAPRTPFLNLQTPAKDAIETTGVLSFNRLSDYAGILSNLNQESAARQKQDVLKIAEEAKQVAATATTKADNAARSATDAETDSKSAQTASEEVANEQSLMASDSAWNEQRKSQAAAVSARQSAALAHDAAKNAHQSAITAANASTIEEARTALRAVNAYYAQSERNAEQAQTHANVAGQALARIGTINFGGLYATNVVSYADAFYAPYATIKDNVYPRKHSKEVEIPQQHLGCNSGTGTCSTGSLRTNVGESGYLGSLVGFRADFIPDHGPVENKNITVALDRNLNQRLADNQQAILAIGSYRTNGPWPADSSNSESSGYKFATDRMWFAEGLLTSSADLQALKANNQVALYSGPAFGDVYFNAESASICDTSPCGTFSTTLDFGKGLARDFNLSLTTSSAEVSIKSNHDVSLNNGRFALNSGDCSGGGDACFKLGHLNNGQLQEGTGVVSAATFGKSAHAVGGVFFIEGPHHHRASGTFGGTRN